MARGFLFPASLAAEGVWAKALRARQILACPVPGAQCLVPGVRCPVPSARCPVPGAQCPVPGARCPVPGARRPVKSEPLNPTP
eukprot:15445019-Alexandrium_andersonii.AAC.2